MSAPAGTSSGWRGPLARRIESPRVQTALIALILVNAAIPGLGARKRYAPTGAGGIRWPCPRSPRATPTARLGDLPEVAKALEIHHANPSVYSNKYT